MLFIKDGRNRESLLVPIDSLIETYFEASTYYMLPAPHHFATDILSNMKHFV